MKYEDYIRKFIDLNELPEETSSMLERFLENLKRGKFISSDLHQSDVEPGTHDWDEEEREDWVHFRIEENEGRCQPDWSAGTPADRVIWTGEVFIPAGVDAEGSDEFKTVKQHGIVRLWRIRGKQCHQWTPDDVQYAMQMVQKHLDDVTGYVYELDENWIRSDTFVHLLSAETKIESKLAHVSL